MSNYNLLAVRTGEEPESTLFPDPGELPDSVEPEPSDGILPLQFQTTELNLRELNAARQSKRISRIKDIKAQVIVTDARIAVACTKYEKGGGFSAFTPGALPLALGLNAVSKVRTARKRRGKMLVGHIRYSRLLAVGFMEKSGMLYPARLRIATLDPTVQGFRGLVLDINLPKDQSGPALAQRIARQAAIYNLAQGDELDAELRQHLEGLRQAPILAPVAKGFAAYVMVHTNAESTATAMAAAG